MDKIKPQNLFVTAIFIKEMFIHDALFLKQTNNRQINLNIMYFPISASKNYNCANLNIETKRF